LTNPENQIDLLFDLKRPGPEPRSLRLAKARASYLAETLTLCANKSPRYRKTSAGPFLEAAASLRKGPLVSKDEALKDQDCQKGQDYQKDLGHGPPSYIGHARENDARLRDKEALAREREGPAQEREALAWENFTRAILAGLPFTTESELAESPESFLACGQSEIESVITIPTSGSSGPPKRIFSTLSDLEETAAFFRYGMLHLVSESDRVALLMSSLRPGTVGDLLTRGLKSWGIPVKVMGPAPAPLSRDWLFELESFSPTCLVGLPSQLFLLSRRLPPPGPVKTVLLSGEASPVSLKKAIAASWKVAVFDHYGQTETGLAGAVDCPRILGPHLREAELMAEIAGPKGEIVPDGETGELILTTLTRRAMPLVRYKTGDLGRLLKDKCPCGSAMARLIVLGRVKDELETARGPLTLSEMGEALYALPSLAGFKAALSPGPLLSLSVIPAENGPWGLAQAAKEAGEALGSLLGGYPPFEILAADPGHVPAASGAKPVLSR
jgi:phenylacetate-coenzyme A ligase PaaK-like adenylate-forming protein